MEVTRYSSQILVNTDDSVQMSRKSSKVKFHENPSSRSGDVTCGPREREREREKMDGRTDERTDGQL